MTVLPPDERRYRGTVAAVSRNDGLRLDSIAAEANPELPQHRQGSGSTPGKALPETKTEETFRALRKITGALLFECIDGVPFDGRQDQPPDTRLPLELAESHLEARVSIGDRREVLITPDAGLHHSQH
jgi:hypothetical protein